MRYGPLGILDLPTRTRSCQVTVATIGRVRHICYVRPSGAISAASASRFSSAGWRGSEGAIGISEAEIAPSQV